MSAESQNTGNVPAEDIEVAEKYKNEANEHFKSRSFECTSV